MDWIQYTSSADSLQCLGGLDAARVRKKSCPPSVSLLWLGSSAARYLCKLPSNAQRCSVADMASMMSIGLVSKQIRILARHGTFPADRPQIVRIGTRDQLDRAPMPAKQLACSKPCCEPCLTVANLSGVVPRLSVEQHIGGTSKQQMDKVIETGLASAEQQLLTTTLHPCSDQGN